MPGLGDASTTDGINSMALQQGGLGLLLTTMIISAPPMAAAFFQGTLGQFSAYSPFGHIKPEPAGARGGGGYGPPGSPTYLPPSGTPDRDGRLSGSNNFSSNTSSMGGAGYAPPQDGIKQMNTSGREQAP
jgi:type IV secretion system protein VirB6